MSRASSMFTMTTKYPRWWGLWGKTKVPNQSRCCWGSRTRKPNQIRSSSFSEWIRIRWISCNNISNKKRWYLTYPLKSTWSWIYTTSRIVWCGSLTLKMLKNLFMLHFITFRYLIINVYKKMGEQLLRLSASTLNLTRLVTLTIKFDDSLISERWVVESLGLFCFGLPCLTVLDFSAAGNQISSGGKKDQYNDFTII